ncbi:MAG TPA: 2'-5' RNA ligase family protein [Usitatibacter sp.]|nr:2'-5' RNA ligase family protein [Usitatibacter sp.]
MPRSRMPARPALPRFAVAWFPRFEGIERIESFRRRHDPMAALVPAHLSLVFPFPTALTALQVRTHVQRVVSLWPPIPVTFRHVRLYANEFLFLMASRGAASISALHDRLYTRSLRPHLRRDLPYEPHITVAREARLEKLEAALDEAHDEFRGEFSEVMREVTLLAVAGNGRISPLGTFALHSA